VRTFQYCALLFTFLFLFIAAAMAATNQGLSAKDLPHGPLGIFVTDGSPVHDVGNLRLHAPNWGEFGSLPGSGLYANAPSMEWPKGSSVEYLFAGGLWVGGLVDGIPKVSTSAYEIEFRPTNDVHDVVYRSAFGASGGNRIPSPAADDDADGQTNEDPLDGYDNDGDGKVDEDFAAISDQMFSRIFADNNPGGPASHQPLNLFVREESYQFSNSDFDDFVGVTFLITNVGNQTIQNAYLGMFADGDVGFRTRPTYWDDDAVGFQADLPVDHGAHGVQLYDFAYWYDLNGDQGQAPGYAGIVILDHPTDPSGVSAPVQVGASSFALFSGSQSYEDGGDPTNDFERYELMSSHNIGRPLTVARDYRIMVSCGPFASIAPGQTVKFSIALVVTPRGDFTHVQRAAQAHHGLWFDLDGNPSTGIDGREHQENWYLPENPVPVAITSFEARSTSGGVALAWHLWSDEAIEGIDVLRAARGGELVPLVSSLAATAQGYVDRTALPGTSYEYQLVVHSRESGVILSQRASATVPRAALAFHPITPNPFTSETTLSFSLAERSPVDLTVYDVSGRRVATVFAGESSAGDHAFHWNGVGDNGNRASAGIYFCRLRAGKETLTRKISLVR
jgi:hypothetical protein